MRLKAVRCGQCGGQVQLPAGATSGRCSHCGAEVSAGPAPRTDAPNPTPLRLGMKGRFGSRLYDLTGRLALSCTEEGETSFWQEFFLVAPDGDIAYLEYDEGQWKISTPFVPQHPVAPQELAAMSAGRRILLEEVAARVTEVGRATICHVEGEMGHPTRYRGCPEVGDSVGYLDARHVNRFYSIEWDPPAVGAPDEIEFYRGQFLSEREVYQAFDLKSELVDLDRRDRLRANRQLFASVCLLLSLIAFIGWGLSLMGGRVVAQGSVPIDSVGPEGARFGPLNLDPALRVHRLVITGQMDQASAWVGGVLEAGDGRELIGTQRDFWDERGTDSDGPWHESDLRAQTDFVVRRPGPYYVRLYVERDPSAGTFQNAGYELRGGVWYPTYVAVYAVFALVLSFLFFCAASQATLRKMAASDD